MVQLAHHSHHFAVFKAFVGASFAEIFAGNCLALGLVCATLAPADLAKLMDSVSLDPKQTLVLDLEGRNIVYRGGRLAASIPESARGQLLEGTWNATAVLLEAGERIEQTARRLPGLG